MDLSQVNIVLVRPRGSRNLGSVARAMKNGGLSRLSLVDSRIGKWTDAREMAVHAGDILDNVEQFDTLEAALATSTWVVATTMRPLGNQVVLSPREVAVEIAARGAATLVFGDEESGLQNSELLRCHATSRIATSIEQPSLNLAQAVVVYVYELFALAGAPMAVPTEPLASGALLSKIESELRAVLDAARFSDLDRPRHGIVDLLQPLYRANLTEAEGRLWMAALTRLRSGKR